MKKNSNILSFIQLLISFPWSLWHSKYITEKFYTRKKTTFSSSTRNYTVLNFSGKKKTENGTCRFYAKEWSAKEFGLKDFVRFVTIAAENNGFCKQISMSTPKWKAIKGNSNLTIRILETLRNTKKVKVGQSCSI